MNKIKKLSLQEAQKVAAGEVVERPSNIVKELIENSLDAGATTISLYIEKAGKELIRVVDDGCGMSADDARSCFENHATSKIEKVDDITTITSFGFRGEALASISAVSKVTLVTKSREQADDELGYLVECSQSRITRGPIEVSSSYGSDFQIRDLFFNIPARRKFLKRDDTEQNHIQNLFYAFCLSHQAIHFKYFNDGKLVLNAPPVVSLKERISQIWGYNVAQNLLEIEQCAEKSWFSISGCISNHHFWRYGRTHLYFFVNNRWIKDQEISRALMKGYSNVLPPEKFPAAFIFFTVDSHEVDINVHPKKEEVRFVKPGAVRVGLQDRIRETLEASISARFVKSEQPGIAQKSEHVFSWPKRDEMPFERTVFQPKIFESVQPVKVSLAAQIPQPVKVVGFENFHDSEKEEIQKLVQTPYRLIGQLFATYILVEGDEECIVIDQHAAHERILYERFKERFEQKEGTLLMFPETLKLSPEEVLLLMREQQFFTQQGIELERTGKDEVSIKTSPPRIQNQQLKELVLEVLEFIREHEHFDREEFRKKLNEHMHGQMACKAAVKAGDVLTVEQMKQLIEDLQKIKHRFICVHGRPTLWSISKSSLEKHFRRC